MIFSITRGIFVWPSFIDFLSSFWWFHEYLAINLETKVVSRRENKIIWNHLGIRLGRSDGTRAQPDVQPVWTFFLHFICTTLGSRFIPKQLWISHPKKKINEIQATKIEKYARFILTFSFGDVLDKNTAKKTEQSWCWSPALVIFWTKILQLEGVRSLVPLLPRPNIWLEGEVRFQTSAYLPSWWNDQPEYSGPFCVLKSRHHRPFGEGRVEIFFMLGDSRPGTCCGRTHTHTHTYTHTASTQASN